MAQRSTQKHTDRNIVHCLKCHKAQYNISVHLTRVCMKNNTPAERSAEVQKTKASHRQWTLSSRSWDYSRMCKIVHNRSDRFRMLKEFRECGFLLDNVPNESDSEGDAASTSETAHASSGTDASNPSSSPPSDQDGEPSDPTWQKTLPTPTTSVRLKMEAAGLYEKFPDNVPLIKDFKKYLNVTLDIRNCQQEVDNVSRFLRYMQPTGNDPTFDFLTKSIETRDYIHNLQLTGMTGETVLNYLKNIIRFVDYLKTRLELTITNTDLRNKCAAYTDLIKTLRKPVSKGHTKQVVQTRYERFHGGQSSVKDCQVILNVAKTDFLKIFHQLFSKEGPISEKQKTTYRYYCEAIMVFRHFQRPGAVEGFSLQEWLDRRKINGRALIGIRDHKTATQQIASVALTQEEEAWFQMYYERIRPDYLNDDDCEKFFISANGKPIHSVTSDMGRLHSSFKVDPLTSQAVRRAVEANALFSTSQKDNVSNYLAHSSSTAKSSYRMLVPDQIVATSVLLETLGGSSPEKSDIQSDIQSGKKCYLDYTNCYPVTLEGQPPKKKQRMADGFPEDRTFYDKWRTDQYKKRAKWLLSKFTDRKPSVGKVSRLLKSENWKANHPTANVILQMWKPAPKYEVQDDPKVKRGVLFQKWKGLAIKHISENKGMGVIATRNFAKGDIICDYHGEVIAAADGRTKMTAMGWQPSYMFFFKTGERALCIDADTHPCKCHPNSDTVGRRINHSRKNPNLKPQHCNLNVDGGKDVILFKAMKDIKVDDELRFDYGVNQKSFRGKGLNLEWLND